MRFTLSNEAINCFPHRLKQTIGNTSIRTFAKKCGVSEAVVRNYLAGKTFPSLDKLALMAEVGEKSLEWLCSGSSNYLSGEGVEDLSNYLSGEGVEDLSKEFALIPGYTIQVSAGHGALNTDNLESSRYLAFHRKWLKFRGFSEKDLAIVWAKGDSMEPTINNNDILVVHVGRKIPQDGHIYIFRDETQLFVKRYQSIIGAWRLISDNPMYTPLDIKREEQHQFEVIGQVVHISKDIGD
ncbi:XRE family transcriptional regulator [Marinomonas sp. THO17]